MFDLSTVGNALSRLKELQKSIDNVDYQEQLVDLLSIIVDMKEEIVNLCEQNISLKQAAMKVTEQKDVFASLIEVDGYLYRRDDHDKPIDYPFCPKCLKVAGGPFKTIKQNEYYSKCPNCRQSYNAAKNGMVNESMSVPSRSFGRDGW